VIFYVRTVFRIVEQPPLADKGAILNDIAGTILASPRLAIESEDQQSLLAERQRPPSVLMA